MMQESLDLLVAKFSRIAVMVLREIANACQIRLSRPIAQVFEQHVPFHLVAQFSHRSSPFVEGDVTGIAKVYQFRD
jgi:hypothetical protein